MEIKLFGKSIFNYKSAKSEQIFALAGDSLKESKYLPDFYGDTRNSFIDEYAIIESSSGGAVAVPIDNRGGGGGNEKIEITPKGLYYLKSLNDDGFKLNTDTKYIDEQLADFKDKLNLIKSEEYDMRNGVKEISSVITRLENRKKYAEVKDYFEVYPYTTTTKINEVIKAHDYLKLGQVAQFLADMPKEATDAMKHYDEGVKKLCEKKAVYYIIANKKDFKKTSSRRDPILLAQSPFGHVWQILGAWDEEMLLLENL